jgi:hypothetical protein
MMKKKLHRHVTAYAAATLALAGLASCERASPNDPAPPSGGQNYVLSFDEFSTTVNPALSRLGCDNLTCHGGGIRGTFALTPPEAKSDTADFEQARLQVYPSVPAQSPLLAKTVAAEFGGVPHAGGTFFSSPDDPDYVAILTWIENGEYR